MFCYVLFYNFVWLDLLDLVRFVFVSSNSFELIFGPLHGVANGKSMNDIRNMHEVRFPNISTLFNIINYVLPLTIIIVLAIKA